MSATDALGVPPPGLLFANYAQACKVFAERIVPYNWQAPVSDQTMPACQADRENYVLHMMAAFIDISQCHDSTNTESFQERWAGLSEDFSPYTTDMIKTICWTMLDMAIALHERGPVVLRVFDDSKLKNAQKSRKLTLSERIGFICDLLRLTKSRCETLLNYDDMDMTFAAPAQMIAMAKTNKKQNIKRKIVLVIGRETLMAKGRLAAKGAIVDGKEGGDDEECHNHNHQGPLPPTTSYISAAHLSTYPIVDTAEPNALLLQYPRTPFISEDDASAQAHDLRDQEYPFSSWLKVMSQGPSKRRNLSASSSRRSAQ